MSFWFCAIGFTVLFFFFFFLIFVDIFEFWQWCLFCFYKFWKNSHPNKHTLLFVEFEYWSSQICLMAQVIKVDLTWNLTSYWAMNYEYAWNVLLPCSCLWTLRQSHFSSFLLKKLLVIRSRFFKLQLEYVALGTKLHHIQSSQSLSITTSRNNINPNKHQPQSLLLMKVLRIQHRRVFCSLWHWTSVWVCFWMCDNFYLLWHWSFV